MCVHVLHSFLTVGIVSDDLGGHIKRKEIFENESRT